MSAKQNAPVSGNADRYCQHISAKGHRCHMLLDNHHRPPNGEKRPGLCAYHANRLSATSPAPFLINDLIRSRAASVAPLRAEVQASETTEGEATPVFQS